MHNSLQLIDRTCEYNEASSYERRRSAMNNPGAVELKRVEIGSVWSLRLFVDAESARQWGMELKKGDTDETRIFLFSMKTSCWHWSTGVPFPIGCLNLWPFRAQSMVELSPSFEATSYLVLYPFWLHLWTDHLRVYMCVHFLDTISREGSSARVSSSSSSLLLEFSFYTHICTYISKFDSRFDGFFHGLRKIDLSASPNFA